MWKIGGLVIMIVLACRHTNGHEEGLLFENDSDLDWEENDIWIDQQKTKTDLPRTLLETLCGQYDLSYQNKIIDCQQIQIVSKALKVDHHVLRKREADEELEGSGDDNPFPVPEVGKDEPPSVPSAHEQDESPKETEESIKTEDQPAPELPKETEEPKEEIKPEPEGKAVAEEVEKAQEQPTASDIPIPGVEPLQTTSATAEKATEETKKEEAKSQETEAKPEETKPEEPKPEESEPKKEESKVAVELPVVEGDKVELSEAGKGQESDAKSGRKMTQEDLNNQQSGIALLNSNGNMIETDTKVGGMKPNESIKVAAAGEEPKTGAASEGSARNNTLLIGLFVAILVVGAAAFSYNFVKRRRSRAAAQITEQNGTKRTADPEEGREMKPLMKTDEPKNNVEFMDEK